MFGVLTYDTTHNKQGGKIPFKILKSLNINYSIISEIINSFCVEIKLASWPAVKSHMADHLLFKKEDNFCMTFLVSHWPANPKVVGQMAYKCSTKWLICMK